MEIYVYETVVSSKTGKESMYRFTFTNEDLYKIFGFIDDCIRNPLDNVSSVKYQITTTFKEEYYNGIKK